MERNNVFISYVHEFIFPFIRKYSDGYWRRRNCKCMKMMSIFAWWFVGCDRGRGTLLDFSIYTTPANCASQYCCVNFVAVVTDLVFDDVVLETEQTIFCRHASDRPFGRILQQRIEYIYVLLVYFQICRNYQLTFTFCECVGHTQHTECEYIEYVIGT